MIFSGIGNNNPMYTEMNFYNADNTDDKLTLISTIANITTGATFPVSFECWSKWRNAAPITRIDMVGANTGVQENYAVGSRLLVLATPT